MKISIFWPKIILKTSKNDQIEVVGHKFLNALYNETTENFRIEKLKNSNFVPKNCISTVVVFTILFEILRVGIALTSIFSIVVFTTQICLENDDSPQTMFKLSLAISDMFTGLVGVSAGLIRCYNDLYKLHRIVAFGYLNTYRVVLQKISLK